MTYIFSIKKLIGQVPTHVPTAQSQGLGAPIPNLQQGLVQTPLNPPAPIEEQEPQVIDEPIEEPLETSYNEPQESEPETELPIESGKITKKLLEFLAHNSISRYICPFLKY